MRSADRPRLRDTLVALCNGLTRLTEATAALLLLAVVVINLIGVFYRFVLVDPIGWTEDSALTLDGAIESYRRAGLRHVLCTDVARDGALSGPNVELYRAVRSAWPDIALQASGGIRDAGDLAALAAADVAAAISGKALLEQRIRFEEIRTFLPNA